jgi:hypothetical protein
MSFSKRSNAKSRQSASQTVGQLSLRPVGHAEQTRSSETKSGFTNGNPQRFVEDFGLEHSFSRVSTAHLAILARSGIRKSETPGYSCANDESWPSCVYIG